MVRIFLKSAISFFLYAVSVASAWAVEPLSGMWYYEGELTGEPGRGVQIDYQGGDLLLMTYFGYRADGSSMFLQAAGHISRDGDFAGLLWEYGGGTALGAAHQNGVAAEYLGEVRAVFDSFSTGTLTLPGEGAKRIRRFVFTDLSERFGDALVTIYDNLNFSLRSRSGRASMEAVDGQFKMRLTRHHYDSQDVSSICNFEGTYVPTGRGIQAEGTVSCDNDSPRSFRSGELVMSGDGFFTGSFDLGWYGRWVLQGVCPGAVFMTQMPCSFR